ncbi:hypothetical protein A3F60_00385 [Candidatus Roizmanbacteria bacterium RIFCSPHIGHO2_12_FULL_39_8]|uniref:histidine kinase n=1 Tax=Candidatus Roizmanbacteria bacterium RIFCSPHIGHO2_12_FULL_39_8 TaxID=1802050 RepID=A0A1F7HX66_9BACT|nr:MAG: hypothetical protein A3F60_00385 [Candidatus Roizmanbacteria bacterium RIFCSPHIGHO2_12_FULL_39_8]
MKNVRLETNDLYKYKLAVESSSNHIVFTDKNGYILYANKAAEILTGYSFAEMKGKTPRLWGGLMPKEFYAKMWKTLKEEKKPFVGEIKNRRKKGETYTAIARISPLLDKNRQLLGFVATEEDISERVIYEDNLRELYNTKTQFIAIASHQLRTPQGIIKWSIELLLADKDLHLNPQQMQLFNQIAKANKQMIALIDTLLKITRTNLKIS